jgi:hypothetical protein
LAGEPVNNVFPIVIAIAVPATGFQQRPAHSPKQGGKGQKTAINGHFYERPEADWEVETTKKKLIPPVKEGSSPVAAGYYRERQFKEPGCSEWLV